MNELKNKKYSNVVAIDFDGTITEMDVVDGLLVQFAQGKEWIDIEKQWANGLISSKDCMIQQLERIRVQSDDLYGFLEQIDLDPGFGNLKSYLDRQQIPLVILSDGFDLFIDHILSYRGFHNISFRANKIRHVNDRLIPEFPYWTNTCSKCGHCKQKTLAEIKRIVDKVVFIGDGLSDRCALSACDHVFAKHKLKKYCDENNILYQPYNNLNDIVPELSVIFEIPDIQIQA